MAVLMCVDLNQESDFVEEEGESKEKHENGNRNVLEILQLEMNKLKDKGSYDAPWLELEELGIDDKMLCTLDLSSKFPAFSCTALPSLSHLNLRGNPLAETSVHYLLELLGGFSNLKELEVDIPGPLGPSAIKILEYLPNSSMLNGVDRLSIIEQGKHVIDSALQPRLPQWTPDEPLAERVIGANWLYLMTYRLADEEKIDETSVCFRTY